VAAEHIMDHFRDENRFSNACATEETGFAAPFQRGKDINGFNSGFKDFRNGRLLAQRYRLPVYGSPFPPGNRIFLVDDLTEYVENPSKKSFADGTAQRVAGIDNRGSIGQALRGYERNTADHFGIEVGDHLYNDSSVIAGAQEIVEGWKFAWKGCVNDASPDRRNSSYVWIVITRFMGSFMFVHVRASLRSYKKVRMK